MGISKMGCISSISIMLYLIAIGATGQEILTLDMALIRAMDNNPQLKLSGKQIEHDRRLERTAWNLPDPELILESPTGAFMTLGVEQSMEFPTVYVRQKQLARQQTRVSEKAQQITEATFRRKIKQAYLDWQYALARYQQQKTRDSLYADIARTASRQYEAGQIDFVEKTYADVHYTSSHGEWLGAEADLTHSYFQIQEYLATADSLIPTPFVKMEDESLMTILIATGSKPEGTPLLDYSMQREKYAESAIRLEKSRALPDLTVGYLNPADKNTPIGMRIRFGVSIPIWFWQYKANINAAKTRYEINKLETAGVKQEWILEWNEIRREALKNYNTLTYYETNGLSQAEDMIRASGRMFAAGAYDYIRYLTTMADAFRIREQYLSAVYAYNQSLIQLQYLIGQ